MEEGGILVEDLLLEEDYDRYLNKYHSGKFVVSQYYCNVSYIDKLGFGFQRLLEFQKLSGFLNLKDSYDSSQIKYFYCNVERQDDCVSFVRPFKSKVVTLTPVCWANLVGLDCEGIDIESDSTFTSYDKVGFVNRISKTCVGALEYSNFSVM